MFKKSFQLTSQLIGSLNQSKPICKCKFSTHVSSTKILNSQVYQSRNIDRENYNFIVLHATLTKLENYSTILNQNGLLELGNVHYVETHHHGKSPHQKEKATLRDMSLAVEDYVNQKNLKNIYIIGHSLGGRIGSQLAISIKQQSLIKGVVILDVLPIRYHDRVQYQYLFENQFFLTQLDQIKIHEMNKKELQNQFLELGQGQQNFVQSLMECVEEYHDQNDKSNKFRWVHNINMISNNLNNVYQFPVYPNEQYHGPVKFLLSEQSYYAHPSDFPQLKNVFPNINLEKDIEQVQGAGHFIHIYQPREMIERISSFVNEINSKS